MTHFDLFEPFLGWWRHHGEAKLQNFEIVILKTNTSLYFWLSFNCVKSVRIWSYYGPCFPAFWLNTEWYEVSLRIQSGCGKIRTRITPNTENVQAVLSIIIGTWNSGSFWIKYLVNDVTTEIKTTIFWESDLRNKLLTSKFDQILISIYLSPLMHNIKLWLNIEIITSQKK